MKYRHEWKHEISYFDLLTLRQRFSILLQTDPYAVNGAYIVKSLYFDNDSDKALREKLDGVNVREKFRIRYYNNDLSMIRLEKKSKRNQLCAKESILLTQEQAQAILDGSFFPLESAPPLLQELYSKTHSQGLKPKTIVQYTREPFVYPAGNVRLTLDYDIRTGIYNTDFFRQDSLTVPIREPTIILEVKWDEFLPSMIRDALQLPGVHAAAFSKYAVCRSYG
ncbi:MAG: polyphosphate polymerase domain-containing protein [Ruminococcaceae bacterium]|nr:polyphosphate polymerase domain-containing protein [Oscillospiraceae bacterium]